MKTYYTVRFELDIAAVNGKPLEDCWIYRCFDSEKEALKAAGLLSTFIPFYMYKGFVIVYKNTKKKEIVILKLLCGNEHKEPQEIEL